jgi:hypothetical protein
MRGNLPQDPAYRMRAIRRFPLPDSHVSLSAVLEPGPNAQPALSPRPAPGQSNLPHNRATPHPKPTLTDTPRHHNPPRPQTRPPTPLPDCCATQTAASLRPSTQSLRPSPASTTNPHRQSNTTRDLHALKAHNRRRRQCPLPAIEHQDACTNSFRPKLQPPPQPGVRPQRDPTDQDKTWTLALSELGHRRPAFRDAAHSANHLFARYVSIYQLKTLTEQRINKHYTAFTRR